MLRKMWFSVVGENPIKKTFYPSRPYTWYHTIRTLCARLMTLYAKMDIQVNEINQNGISHFNPEAMHVSDQSAIEWLSELDTRKN